MKSPVFVVVLALLNLAILVYLVVTMPRSNEAPVVTPVSSESVTVAASPADTDSLRFEIEALGARLEERLDRIDGRLALPQGGPGAAAGARPMVGPDGYVLTPDEANDAFAARVAETVQTQLDAKLERLASRERNRNMGGEWKAPMGELAEELELSADQEEKATAIFDEARDDVFDLLKTERADGGSLLDDLVTSLEQGDPNPFGGFVQRIFSEKVPDSDRTYLAEMISLSQEVRTNLSDHLSEGQMQRLGELNVAVLEVETGYDPVAEYIERSMAE